MARLRNVVSGAIVNVADEKVERLGSQWVPVDSDAPAKKAPAKKAASSSKSDDE